MPGLIPYRPVWTGIGVLAAELALLSTCRSAFRTRIGVKAWRRLHFATYAVFAGGAVHGIAAGTDTGSTSARMLYGGLGRRRGRPHRLAGRHGATGAGPQTGTGPSD